MGKRLTTEEFIKRANVIYNNKYNYSKVEYINNDIKVCIICPIHGEFWQTPHTHLKGQGCKKCGIMKYKLTTKEFIERAKEIHGDKYDYSKVEYTGALSKVCIICPIHGEFWQEASSHIKKKNGCPLCNGRIKNTTRFIERAKEIHGDKYDYSKVEYINSTSKICIICPIHGEFWQEPRHHLNSKNGCPICKESKLEREINDFLKENNILFERQKHFDWLGRQSLDFYLPDYNMAIECQGEQHFMVRDYFNNEKELQKQINRDNKKLNLCNLNNIKLIYYSNLGITYPYNVLENKNEILNIINNG